MKKLFVALLSTLVFTTPAMAAHGATRTVSSSSAQGYDIGYPQCNTTYPTASKFAVVGVNDGLANNLNPCFSSELAWAQTSNGTTAQPKAALYVNTGNPGDVTPAVADWPTTGTNAYGTCDGSNSAACAYEYGKARATQDVAWVGSGTWDWWLDVETSNSWSSNTANNRADLEGMTEYFQSVGGAVGVYSTTAQWNTIGGGAVASTSSLYSLAEWGAGASSLSIAQSNCVNAKPFLGAGSHNSIMQYKPANSRVDDDYSCI